MLLPKADIFRLGENKKIRCPTTDFFARSPVNTPLNAKSGVMDKTGAFFETWDSNGQNGCF